jgi:chorismate synthase
MSVQSVKSVEIGLGLQSSKVPGSQMHDEIYYGISSKRKYIENWRGEQSFYRLTNNAGGIEGGMTNGEPVLIRCAVKPIPTLMKPLQTVDIDSKCAVAATTERSDVCAVPAAAVVLEAAVALEIASCFTDKFAGDSIEECLEGYNNYVEFEREY